MPYFTKEEIDKIESGGETQRVSEGWTTVKIVSAVESMVLPDGNKVAVGSEGVPDESEVEYYKLTLLVLPEGHSDSRGVTFFARSKTRWTLAEIYRRLGVKPKESENGFYYDPGDLVGKTALFFFYKAPSTGDFPYRWNVSRYVLPPGATEAQRERARASFINDVKRGYVKVDSSSIYSATENVSVAPEPPISDSTEEEEDDLPF